LRQQTVDERGRKSDPHIGIAVERVHRFGELANPLVVGKTDVLVGVG